MSTSITLANLCLSSPDGRQLLNNLDLNFSTGRTGLVGRNGVGKSTLLRLIAGEIRPNSGTVHVTGTTAWMRQDLGTDPDETIADLFGVTSALALLDQAESELVDLERLAEADWTLPARVEAALLRCNLAVDIHAPLASLSGGQRTRASLAALTFTEPDFLLLDEPTNNLDRIGRKAVIELIKGWRGGVIIASHDRELLAEMDAIVELTSLGATRYGGNYSAYLARKSEELQSASRDLAHATKQTAETQRRTQQAAERKARKDSVGRKSRAKGDQPKIVLDAAKARADASGGANSRLRAARIEEAEKAVAAAREKVEILQPLCMEIPPTHLHAGKLVLHLDRLTGGHDPAHPVVRDLSFSINGPERIAITGTNGCGKTTLLSLITGQLAPQSGRVDLHVPFALLDQHVGLLDPDLSLRDNFMHLNDTADENQCRAALARFQFRAGDALQKAGDLSGGQKLRAGLACTLGRSEPPPLLILDEPTNHLDLDAKEALEISLEGYDGALLVVSHDEVFLKHIGINRKVELRALSKG